MLTLIRQRRVIISTNFRVWGIVKIILSKVVAISLFINNISFDFFMQILCWFLFLFFFFFFSMIEFCDNPLHGLVWLFAVKYKYIGYLYTIRIALLLLDLLSEISKSTFHKKLKLTWRMQSIWCRHIYHLRSTCTKMIAQMNHTPPCPQCIMTISGLRSMQMWHFCSSLFLLLCLLSACTGTSPARTKSTSEIFLRNIGDVGMNEINFWNDSGSNGVFICRNHIEKEF